MNNLSKEQQITLLRHDIENLIQGTSDILELCLDYIETHKINEAKQTLDNLKIEIEQRKKHIIDKIDSIALK